MKMIELIDGIAKERGVTDGTRAKWLVRGSVPHKDRLPILQIAAARGIVIDPAVFDSYRKEKS